MLYFSFAFAVSWYNLSVCLGHLYMEVCHVHAVSDDFSVRILWYHTSIVCLIIIVFSLLCTVLSSEAWPPVGCLFRYPLWWYNLMCRGALQLSFTRSRCLIGSCGVFQCYNIIVITDSLSTLLWPPTLLGLSVSTLLCPYCLRQPSRSLRYRTTKIG